MTLKLSKFVDEIEPGQSHAVNALAAWLRSYSAAFDGTLVPNTENSMALAQRMIDEAKEGAR